MKSDYGADVDGMTVNLTGGRDLKQSKRADSPFYK